MDSDWAVLLKTMTTIEDKNIPSRRTEFNPGSINLFSTICDYDEEKKHDDDEKRYLAHF